MKEMTIRELRERVGLSQNELARQLGCHGQQISNVERELAFLPPKHFRKVAEICKVRVSDLIDLCVRRYEKRIKEKVYGR